MRCRPRLEMLNLSQNRLDNVRGLKTLGGLIALNLGTHRPCTLDFRLPVFRCAVIPLISMVDRQSTGASTELFFALMYSQALTLFVLCRQQWIERTRDGSRRRRR